MAAMCNPEQRLRRGKLQQPKAREAQEAAPGLSGALEPRWAVWEGRDGAGGTRKEDSQGPSPATLSRGLNESGDHPGPHPGLQPGGAPEEPGRMRVKRSAVAPHYLGSDPFSAS